jgi:hypothetical protein
VTSAPRSAALSTFKLLTAGTGVCCSDGFSVAFARGVGVLESLEMELEHAEITMILIRNANQSLRDEVMLKGHHGNRSKDQEEDEQDKKSECLTFWI